MAKTARGSFTKLVPGQANAEISLNDILDIIEALVDFSPEDEQTAPPGSPTDGQTYIINGTPTGGWADFANKDMVIRLNGGWLAIAPTEGKKAHVRDTNTDKTFDGTNWV